MITAAEIQELLEERQNPEQRTVLMRFFKTGPGEYAEGDEFLGLKVPQTREIVRRARLQVSFAEIEKLLYSRWHEARLCGLLLLVEEMEAALPKRRDLEAELQRKAARRKEITEFYLTHARQANNWDLVDLSCYKILGPYLRLSGGSLTELLLRLSRSSNLWEQRIAIVTTLDFVRHDILAPSLLLADKLLSHRHDLIHKAVGWVLREVGKRDKSLLISYLKQNLARLPRTTYRYAIERLTPADKSSL